MKRVVGRHATQGGIPHLQTDRREAYTGYTTRVYLRVYITVNNTRVYLSGVYNGE